MISSNIPNYVRVALTKAMNHFSNKVRDTLDSGNYPRGDEERNLVPIQDTIVVGTVESKGAGRYKITTTIGDESAPYTKAYEYGSGEHGEGEGEYRIPNEGNDWVAFSVDRWPQYVGDPPISGYFAFPFVMHPGVQAKPFVAPTLEQEKQTIRDILADELLEAIKMEIVR